MHAHCLHWRMSTSLIFQSAFSQPCDFTTGEIVPMEGSKSVGGYDVATTNAVNVMAL